jgi:predicted AlkP superfamily pyrophosphatase or phosphodiesterase
MVTRGLVVRWSRHLILIGLGLATTLSSVGAAPVGPGPKLVVLLVVDQMRADYIDRYSSQWTKGLRRMVTSGAWFRHAAQPYFNSVTCVGHSAISTGTYPASNGIVGNVWYDRDTNRRVACAEDATATTVSYGRPVAGGYSAGRLRMPTFAEELRAQSPGPTRVVTMSMKERTAITLAGQRADAVTWYNPAAQSLVTSSVYTKEPLPWVQAFAKANPIETDFATPWSLALPADRYFYDGLATGAKPPAYWTNSFPHPLTGKPGTPAPQAYLAWEGSPFSDRYLGKLAMAAVDALQLGAGLGTDFLGISFSALDLVGHDFGPNSYEVQDVLIRLDETIGTLLAYLDKTVGEGNYVVALSSDHGVSEIPEQLVAKGNNAGRASANAVAAAATGAMEKSLGPGDSLQSFSQSDLYLTPEAIKKLRGNVEAREALLKALAAVPGVEKAYFGDALAQQIAGGDRDALLVARSYFPGRSGDIVVVPRPNWFFVTDDGSPSPGLADTHGTLYDYDRNVPVLLFGAGVKPGEYWRSVAPVDIAPTLAAICGITLPRPDGEPLTEALSSQIPPGVRAAGRPAAAPPVKK